MTGVGGNMRRRPPQRREKGWVGRPLWEVCGVGGSTEEVRGRTGVAAPAWGLALQLHTRSPHSGSGRCRARGGLKDTWGPLLTGLSPPQPTLS